MGGASFWCDQRRQAPLQTPALDTCDPPLPRMSTLPAPHLLPRPPAAAALGGSAGGVGASPLCAHMPGYRVTLGLSWAPLVM